jgi:hypothetical protein
MLVRRLVVFSGFDTKVVERLRAPLKSAQTDVVFAKLPQPITQAYFDNLIGHTAGYVDETLNKSDSRIVALVASCLEDEELMRLEKGVFFPSFRRLAFPKAFARDVGKAKQIAEALVAKFAANEFLAAYQFIKPGVRAVLSLPYMNADSRRLRNNLENLYELEIYEPHQNLAKEVAHLKAGRGMRIRGIDFRGCVNDPSHPVRRCTDTRLCDVSARLRLGFSVPERFEFDVTCETGLAGKKFQLCGGTTQQIPASASHLNMRMNNDFKVA